MVSQDELNTFRSSVYERYKTFVFWPVTFISHEEMAEAGFYYTAYKHDICGHSYISDMVECVFCGIKLIDWKIGDGPMTEHLKWAPECRFVKDTIIHNHKRCKEVSCLCECEGDVCRSPPYTQHCNIVSNDIPN